MSKSTAKNRVVNSTITSDSYFQSLNASERHLFLHLLINNQTNVAGIYESPISQIAFDTARDKAEIEQILQKFSLDGKFHYVNNHIIVVNFMKHQSMNRNMIIGARKIYNDLPEAVRNSEGFIKYSEVAKSEYPSLFEAGGDIMYSEDKAFEGLGNPSGYLDSDLDTYLDSNSDINSSSDIDSQTSIPKKNDKESKSGDTSSAKAEYSSFSSEEKILNKNKSNVEKSSVRLSCTGKEIEFKRWIKYWDSVNGGNSKITPKRENQIFDALQIFDEEELKKIILFRSRNACWKDPKFVVHKAKWDSFWGSVDKIAKWHDLLMAQGNLKETIKARVNSEAYSRGYIQ